MNKPHPNQSEHDVQITVRLLGTEGEEKRFKIGGTDTLLDVLQEGAQRLGASLLPTEQEPLDRLYNLRHDEPTGPLDLSLTVEEYLHEKDTKRDFAIELVPAIAVNTRWRVATAAQMTPHQILDLFGLDYQSYTLYLPGSADVLPIDTPIETVRDSKFEAQKDGKYGGGC